jgi:rare lipoprotein A
MKIVYMFVFIVMISCSNQVVYKTDGIRGKSENNGSGRIEQKGKIYYLTTSFYGTEFHNKKTASGERYNMYDYTCAHKDFAFGTKLKVTNEDNGRSVVVRVNDRGPFTQGRDLDLSYAAAKKIGLVPHGVKKLKVQVIR